MPIILMRSSPRRIRCWHRLATMSYAASIRTNSPASRLSIPSLDRSEKSTKWPQRSQFMFTPVTLIGRDPVWATAYWWLLVDLPDQIDWSCRSACSTYSSTSWIVFLFISSPSPVNAYLLSVSSGSVQIGSDQSSHIHNYQCQLSWAVRNCWNC